MHLAKSHGIFAQNCLQKCDISHLQFAKYEAKNVAQFCEVREKIRQRRPSHLER